MIFKRASQNFAAMSILTLLLIFLTGCGESGSSIERKWTIMYYGDADCNLETYILEDIAEMKRGFTDYQGLELIVLIDRIGGYSSDSAVLGEDFTDTRLYRITDGKARRITGGAEFPEISETSAYEANVGDAATLKKFIQFCKAAYPAENYALILSNHGGGAGKKKSSSAGDDSQNPDGLTKEICQDATNGGDYLYTAEISDLLTSAESVQLLGLDACFMSSVEFAYQFRNDISNPGFKAEIMVASAPRLWADGWDYEGILGRLQYRSGDNGETDLTFGGNELYYSPATLTAKELGAVILEEQRDSTLNERGQSLTCLDLSKVTEVKKAVDEMAVELALYDNDGARLAALRGTAPAAAILHFFNETGSEEWIKYPFFDLYNLAVKINESSVFGGNVNQKALSVLNAVDAMVLYSFANSDLTGYTADPFVADKSGVHLFFPDGDAKFSGYSNTCWYYQVWYNAKSKAGIQAVNPSYTGSVYGKLAWCIDGIDPDTGKAGNWFELLDSWYDPSNGADGGYNYYQW